MLYAKIVTVCLGVALIVWGALDLSSKLPAWKMPVAFGSAAWMLFFAYLSFRHQRKAARPRP